MIETFKTNLAGIHERISEAAKKSGRETDDVLLIGVTKYVGVEQTMALVSAGCHDLGESRPQLLLEKAEAMSELPVRWHMIGHLQRNKVKRTVEKSHLIHSVDSPRLLTAIDNAASAQGKVAKVLLEVNVSQEEAKHGFGAAELSAAIEFASGLEHVSVKGLMCMAGLMGGDEDARREFSALRELRDAQTGNLPGNVDLTELSMGMSGDFDIAIEEGATIVRVGSLLFENIAR